MSKDTQEVETEETTSQPASTESNTKGVETTAAETTAKTDAPKSETNDQVDYKAELEAAQERIKQAEHTIVQTKRENKELKRSTTSTSNEDIDPDTFETPELRLERERAELRQEYDSKLSKLAADLTADTFEEELASLTQNSDEAALIKFHYENSLKQSGVSRKAIREDLRKARTLANQRKLEIDNAELKESLKAKHSAAKPVTGTNQDPQKPDEQPKFSPQEKAVIERRAAAAGMSFAEYVRKHKTELTT